MVSNTQTASVRTEAPSEVQAHNAEPEKPGCNEEALSQPKKRANTIIRAVADLKLLHKSINNSDPNKDAYDVFGRSVAMQLKKLSEEKALLAQCEIQNTGWGKIPFLLSVGHCEGRGGCRRVGLGSKGAGCQEVPITTLPSHKDGVVQRAERICRQNLLLAKSLYRSGAACILYSLPNPPLGPSTGPKIHSVVG